MASLQHRSSVFLLDPPIERCSQGCHLQTGGQREKHFLRPWISISGQDELIVDNCGKNFSILILMESIQPGPPVTLEQISWIH